MFKCETIVSPYSNHNIKGTSFESKGTQRWAEVV